MTRADMDGRRPAWQARLTLDELENREAPGGWRCWDFGSSWAWRYKSNDSWGYGWHRKFDYDRCDWKRSYTPRVETTCRPAYNPCTPKPPVCQPPAPATSAVGGFVYFDADLSGTYTQGESFFADVPIHLSGTTSTGTAISLDTTTAGDGTYNFGSLAAGNYTISVVTTPDGYVPGHSQAGDFGGTPGVNTVTGVAVPTNQSSDGYNFGMELFRPR